MRQTFQTLISCFVLTSLAFAQDNTPKDFAYYWRQARTSYEAKDYPAYFENMQAVVKFRPDNPNMEYNLAGMYFYKNSLIAIQNGIRPHRVVRFFLNKNFDGVERAEIIEANNPLFNEPTLGVLVQGTFYYVANSQWGSFNKTARFSHRKSCKSRLS
jgi:hypothetical protein